MSMDRKQAEATLVEILDDLKGDRVVGMGFRLYGQVLATACHCLPRAGGQIAFPDPDLPAPALVAVRVRQPGALEGAFAVVVAADPCSDLALLGVPPAAGPEAPGQPPSAGAIEDLIAGREPALVECAPPREGRVFIHTHEKRWVEGIAASSGISIWRPTDRIRRPTSGAPVFDGEGRVVGLVGHNDVRLPEATLCVLSEHLPGWALRGARAAQAARDAAAPRAP